MLEKETDRLLVLIEHRTIGKGDSIMVKEILGAEIPSTIKVFFRTDVERLLESELARSQFDSRFDYKHREVQNLQRQINSILVLNFVFARQDYLQKVDDGVHLLLNYLLRPQWTIANFLLNQKPSVTLGQAREMLRYFGAYEYFKEILFRYAQEKMLDSFTAPDLQKLLFRIDGEYISRKDSLQLTHMLTPIYEFTAFPNFDCRKPVPTKALVKFFEDKRLRSICEMLDQKLTQGAAELHINELQVDLENVRRSSMSAFMPDEQYRPASSPAAAQPERGPKPGTAPSVGIRTALPEEQRPTPAAAAETPRRIRDLEGLFSEDDRKRVVRKVFHKDEGQFRSAVASLNAMQSWKQASVFIDEIFIANGVDPYCAEAVRFSDLAYQHFFPASTKGWSA